jgi:hypothetical protein
MRFGFEHHRNNNNIVKKTEMNNNETQWQLESYSQIPS